MGAALHLPVKRGGWGGRGGRTHPRFGAGRAGGARMRGEGGGGTAQSRAPLTAAARVSGTR
eukprot:4665029-Pleurochrysis_carterae.AAC.1